MARMFIDDLRAAKCLSGASNLLLTSTAMVTMGLMSAPALAQDVPEDETATESSEDIIVTARKRAETIQDVPVAVYALGAETIQKNGITDLMSAAKLTPGLLITRAPANNGANIYLRGIGSSYVSASFDQAVAINIDNVPVSKGRALLQGFFDMQQIEVLKGPQALFFGKNSTAGVVSVKTADPGDEFEGLGRAGYDFGGKRAYGEAVISGPLNDQWGARLAVRASTMNGGFFRNDSTIYTGLPHPRNGPNEDEYGGRATFVFSPDDTFNVNLKISADALNNDGPNNYSQLVYCQGPGGTPQPHFGVPNLANCALDRTSSEPSLSPAIAAGFPGARDDGQLYGKYRGFFTALTANKELGAVTLTSVSGIYKFRTEFFGNFDLGSASQVFSYDEGVYRSLTQEFRIATSFDGPINATAGLFFDDTRFNTHRGLYLRAHPVDPVTGRTDSFDTGGTTDGNTYSAFGELSWTVVPDVEVSGGARYSREVKDSALRVFYASPTSGFALRTSPIFDKFEDDNVSLSGTVRWKPRPNWTIFASYKEGYKSGGTNLNEIPFATVTRDTINYGSESVRGGEVGVKGQLLDNKLWVAGTLYSYDFNDLQVTNLDPITVTRRLENAGKLRTSGAEFDFEYTVPNFDRLKLQGSVYYNHARYINFIGACYTGQTIANGCNLRPTTAGVFTGQDYKGRPPVQAPKWTATFGGALDVPLSEGLMFGATGQARYTGRYFLQETLSPVQFQRAYVDLSGSMRIYSRDTDRWELALIGRNLTNRLVGAVAGDQTGTGSGTGTANGRLSDTYLTVGRPREVILQATVRF